MIIAVDFDGTMKLHNGHANRPLLERLIHEQRNGNVVILWTCREGERLIDAVQFCRKNGFIPSYVNRNAPQSVARMRHDSRKIYADVYIDDKSVRV